MDFNIKNWLDEISVKIKNHFKDRVLFIGFHGSYRRNEATKNSDIDMVLILDKLDLNDLNVYKKIIQTMPFKEKACGFVSGMKEIKNWAKSDLFQFLHETVSLYGNLQDIITELSKEDLELSIKSSTQNLYHAACHSYLYDENKNISLFNLFKNTFFILQTQHFLNKGLYVATKKELLDCLPDTDKFILENCINKDSFQYLDNKQVDELYSVLINWCSNIISSNQDDAKL